jgi:hypothetical protein
MFNLVESKKSKIGETWATNIFNEWKKYQGYSNEWSIAHMSKEEHLYEYIGLIKFTLQLWKHDGSLYPPTLFFSKAF